MEPPPTQHRNRRLPSINRRSSSQARERLPSNLPSPPPHRMARIAPHTLAGALTPYIRQNPAYLEYSQQPPAILSRLPSTPSVQATPEQHPKLIYDVKATLKPDPDSLQFDSRFESGNLSLVSRLSESEFNLVLTPDGNSVTEWFYFVITNTRPDLIYRFHITNMTKPRSLYSCGMQPCVYSERQANLGAKGWHRAGTDVRYAQNPKSGFTLSFSLQFAHSNDTVSVAHSYPYTYSDLNRDINRLLTDPNRRHRLRKSTLCSTMAGNPCPLLTITSFMGDQARVSQRKGVVLMARVHPGESNSSWVMRGLLDYLTGPTAEAKALRDGYVFKVIPMMNPDGVIKGASRCGLAGVDLNRCWGQPSRRLHPTVFHAKNMIKGFAFERDVAVSCDMHGHSSKNNIFVYGCSNANKVLAKMIEKTCDNFCFADCEFGVQKRKEGTARVTLFREMGILNSLTMESSFCGNSAKGVQFTCSDLMLAGRALCRALAEFAEPEEVGKIVCDMEKWEPGSLKDAVRKRRKAKRGVFTKDC